MCLNKLVGFIFSLLLCNQLVSTQSTDDQPTLQNDCNQTDWNTITCVGTFNLTDFLTGRNDSLDNLKIFNTSITTISHETGFTFRKGFLFEKIFIQGAPNLKVIDPATFVPLKNNLKDFRAIATALPDYNTALGSEHLTPFENFTSIISIYVAPDVSSCPPDPSVLFPCVCEQGRLSRTELHGLYGSWSSSSDRIYEINELTCKNDSIDGLVLRSVFRRFVDSSPKVKHFDVVNIEGKSIRFFPKDVFAGVSISTLFIDRVPNLAAIDDQAFEKSPTIQTLQIEQANFSGATTKQVRHIFKALSSLVNLRNLRLFRVGLPFIPNSALVPKNGQKMHNLLYVCIAFDRRDRERQSGVESIGSYAFSGAPNLKEIGLIKNFIKTFEPFAFAFNESRKYPLTVEIGGNPFNDKTGLKPNAFSKANGPLYIKFEIDSFAASDPANDPSFNFLPESVFKPFFEENSENYLHVDYFNVEVWCDVESKWMFESNGQLKTRVQTGFRVIRVEDNLVASYPDSIHCKPQSTFESLPNCLIFPLSNLIHCGGKSFDVKNEFQKLAKYNFVQNVSKLIFSAKGINTIEKEAFGSFSFSQVDFAHATSLGLIHPEAFDPSTSKTLQEFSVINTNLSEYPNFAKFPNLIKAKLDDSRVFNLTKNTFDYSNVKNAANRTLSVFLDNGSFEPDTFSLLNNATLTLNVGVRRVCSTIACLLNCTPTQLKFREEVFRPFFEANSKNQVATSCYLECSSELKWLYQNWDKYKAQFSANNHRHAAKFNCVNPGKVNETATAEKIFGPFPNEGDPAQFFADLKLS